MRIVTRKIKTPLGVLVSTTLETPRGNVVDLAPAKVLLAMLHHHGHIHSN